MFERLTGLPAPGDGIRGVELVVQPGAEPDSAFLERVAKRLASPKDMLGKALPALDGWGGEAAHLHAAWSLVRPVEDARGSAMLFTQALASSLRHRLGGGDEGFVLEANNLGGRLSFRPGGDFLASFCLLYSVSFLHHYWREGSVEPRLVQLLEVADLFFSTDAVLDPHSLPELDGQFPQEVLNSFVNLIHPHPLHVGNLLTKVLLLEDNHDLGEIVADMLSSMGFVVCQAPDGISGLGRLERERFQLILSDIQMPRLNGLGLLKALRDLHLEIPVILTTGFTSIWQEDQALQQGAVAFLPKPFGMADLIQTVDRVLAGTPSHASR